jgi:hypothetical protein
MASWVLFVSRIKKNIEESSTSSVYIWREKEQHGEQQSAKTKTNKEQN